MKTEIRQEMVDLARVADKLTQAIQIRTIAKVDEDEIDWSTFDEFHKFLSEKFPLVHKTLKREVIARADLIYIWEGTDKNLAPIAFLAHQDVVPVTEGTEGDWTHPAWEGYNDGEYIWGRGAIDMKNQLIAVMESVETLLEEGFTPRRSVYLCFGHNEEIMSEKNSGAKNIVAWLQDKGIRFDSVIDEGGAMFPFKVPGILDMVLVGVGIGEKGYADYKVTVKGRGGHSAAPPDHSAIGELAVKIQNLEKHPFPAEMPDYFLELIVSVCERLTFPLSLLAKVVPALKPVITFAMTKIPQGATFIRTCQAVTMCEGSPASNVLPQRASATINFRLVQGTTLSDIEAKIDRYMGGKNVEVERLEGREPKPLSPSDSRAFKTIKKLMEESDKRSIVTPFLVMGGTDSYHYQDICENVYRFSPYDVSVDIMMSAHSTDERIPVKSLGEGVAFFKRYIRIMTAE